MNEQTKKLKELVGVFRSDLHVSRQSYNGQPVYVIHDPISFQTIRLDRSQYTFAAALDGQRKLRNVFFDLVQQGQLNESNELEFYELITNLYRAGIVVLPVHRGSHLFEQHEKLQALKRKKRLLSLLFLRIPLSNPDRFLDCTLPAVKSLFTRWFMIGWLAAGVSALGVLALRFHDFALPLNGVLAPSNLPILWIVCIALKLWHELGHGYACKQFGGRVPEMGTILIVGNPLAYVDATSAWSFPERWKRLVVMCGGMYFETLVAIPAVFVWAASGNGVVGACAYQIIIAASVVTLLFNANPLMKFDGYFILSETLRMPNLRSRADQQLKRALKYSVLGIRTGPNETPRDASILITYGIASAMYRVFLVLSIAWLIATKFPLIGIAVAVYYSLSSMVGIASKTIKYLLFHEETSANRPWARAVAAVLMLGLPTAFALLPIPFDVVTWGVVGAEREQYVRVETPGEFRKSAVRPGQYVDEGQTLMLLSNDVVNAEYRLADVQLQETVLKWRVAREVDVVESALLEAEIRVSERRLAEARRKCNELKIVAPESGFVLRVKDRVESGHFTQVGEAVAIVADGQPIIRLWLTQQQLNDITKESDTPIRFRTAGCAERTFSGKLIAIKPAAESTFTEQALTLFGGGDLAVDPETNRPVQTLFEVCIAPENNALDLTSHGRRVAVAIPREYQSISSWTIRKCFRLLQQLLLA